MNTPRLLTPKAGAAAFALRRRIVRFIAQWASFAIAFFLAIGTVVSILAAGIFGFTPLLVITEGPQAFMRVFPAWMAVAISVGWVCATVVALRSQLAQDQMSLRQAWRSRFWQAGFWSSIVRAMRILPPSMLAKADLTLKSLGRVMNNRTVLGLSEARLVFAALPAFFVALVCAVGFAPNALIANVMILLCALREQVKNHFSASAATPAAFVGAAPSTQAASAARPSLAKRLAGLVSRSIDSLAQEGGEELARRERAVLSKEVKMAAREASENGGSSTQAARRDQPDERARRL